jgi:RimJ/RimL family protein N-acetyltransferase
VRPGPGGLGRDGAGRLSGAPELQSARLRLVPLAVGDAPEMVAVLADPALYAFTGGEPPTLVTLEARYLAQVAGSADDEERWHNWIVRTLDSDEAVGYVQATVTVTDRGLAADVAWVTGTAWQGRGYAAEAAAAMVAWLVGSGVGEVTAHVHPDHAASASVARKAGLAATEEVEDGERVWRLAAG